MTVLGRGIQLLGSSARLVRHGPFDQTTPEGRSSERYRRAALATIAAGASRILATVGVLVAVPLASHQLDAQELGLWLLVVSAVALLGFADMGLGNGLLNVLSDAHGREDGEESRRAISSALFSLVAVAGLLGIAFVLAYPHVPWASLLNATGSASGAAGPAVAILGASVLASIPLGIGQRIHLAHQEGWRASAWSAAGGVMSIAGVVIAAIARAGLDGYLVAVLAGLPVAYLCETVVIFLHERPDLRPRLSFVTTRAATRVVRTGFLFFTLAMAISVAYQSDTLVIAHYLGAAAVTDYVLPLRLFLLAPTALLLIVTPLWPAYGEALARRDLAWVRSTLRRSLAAAVALTVVPSVLLVGLAIPILHLWVGPAVTPPVSLLIAMALWAVVSSLSNALAMFFNGANTIRFQVLTATGMAVVNLGLSIVLVQAIGIAGPMWGSVVAQTFVILVPELIIIRRVLRHPRGGALPGFLRHHFVEQPGEVPI